jgi:hypothetical protein
MKTKTTSASTNTGNCSAPTNTGDCSASTNTGNYSASTNTGNCSASTNTGNYSASTNTGDCSASTVDKSTSVAINTGKEGKSKGGLGSWIVLTERDKDWNIICVRAAKIDGKKLKPNVFYILKNKKFVEVKDND